MTILNEHTNNTKAREIRYISSGYVTSSEEKANDLILVAKVNYNSILKSLKISSSEAYAGLTADLVILNEDKEEITSLTALKTGIDFSTVLDDSDCLPTAIKFNTLEDHIKSGSNLTHYRGLIYLALKIKTPATTVKKGVKMLTDINFIENI